jgi:hypothetical protein
MRRLVGFAAAVATALTVSPAAAQEVLPEQPVGVELPGRVKHLVQGGDGEASPSGTPSVNRRGASTRRSNTPVFYAEFPQLETLPDGTRCLRVIRRGYPDALSAAVAGDAQDRLWRITLADYPRCPGVQAPARTPSVEAAEFWRVQGEDLLPKPAPRIAPGYMLAGKMAYLETGATLATRFEHPTPLGVLTIDATSTVYVDWGDSPRMDGPFTEPGGPWPDGKITHSWTTARTYDITVQQRWSARWWLGGDSGTLDGLTTEASIDDFEVRQLQAVRNV